MPLLYFARIALGPQLFFFSFRYPYNHDDVDGTEIVTLEQTFMDIINKGAAVSQCLFHDTLANSIEVPFEKSIKVSFSNKMCVLSYNQLQK